MKRPLSLVIVAVLFILAGVAAAWDVVSSLFHSRVSFNFCVLMLFAGIGLLRFKRGWRTCALAFVWVFFAGAFLGLGVLIFSPESWTIGLFGSESTAAQRPVIPWLFLICLILLSLWVYRTLTRRDIRRLFGLYDARQVSLPDAPNSAPQ